MFLLNWMEVQKVRMLLLDQSAKNWTPMSHHGPVVTFKFIPKFPNDVLEDLSTDQYYGYKICWSVI